MARVAALAVVLAVVAGTPAAAATGVPVWPAAGKLALPVGANTSRGHQAAALQGVACTSAGNCVAVGYFTDATKSTQAMAVAEAGGTWGRASELTLPAGADVSAGAQAGLSSVACTSAGNCVAVGFYTDSSGSKDRQAMVASETSGVWGQASGSPSAERCGTVLHLFRANRPSPSHDYRDSVCAGGPG
jgi:hypothetical protein